MTDDKASFSADFLFRFTNEFTAPRLEQALGVGTGKQYDRMSNNHAHAPAFVGLLVYLHISVCACVCMCVRVYVHSMISAHCLGMDPADPKLFKNDVFTFEHEPVTRREVFRQLYHLNGYEHFVCVGSLPVDKYPADVPKDVHGIVIDTLPGSPADVQQELLEAAGVIGRLKKFSSPPGKIKVTRVGCQVQVLLFIIRDSYLLFFILFLFHVAWHGNMWTALLINL